MTSGGTTGAGPDLLVTLELAAEVFVPPDGGEFGWAILTALVDDFAWRVDGSTIRMELRKHRTAGRWDWTRSSK